MTKLLYPAPRKYSYNFACDVVEKLFNPSYTPLGEWETCIRHENVNDSVTYFYLDDELVAVYDEASGDLYTTIEP